MKGQASNFNAGIFLIFVVIIMMAIFYFVIVQKAPNNINNINKMNKTAYEQGNPTAGDMIKSSEYSYYFIIPIMVLVFAIIGLIIFIKIAF